MATAGGEGVGLGDAGFRWPFVTDGIGAGAGMRTCPRARLRPSAVKLGMFSFFYRPGWPGLFLRCFW